MLNNEQGLGWGWNPFKKIASVAKKAVVAPTKLAYKTTKWTAKKTIVDPTKIAARSTARAAKGTARAGSQLVRGKFTAAGKSFVRAGLEPVRGTAQLTKHAGKTAYQASKAVTSFLLAPVRSRLNILKNRRAALLAYRARRSKAPSVAEKAQARKDVKKMLSSKGPHGKMLSWLAGPTLTGELGVVGYDDAALAAIATALTTSLIKIMSDAAKSKFAPVDAAKAGVSAGAKTGVTTAAAATAPKIAKVSEKYLAPAEKAAAEAKAWQEMIEEEAAEPVTYDEVAAEPEIEAEEEAEEIETSNVEGVLAGLGWLGGFRGVAEEAAAPAAMSESVAKKVGSAAQRIVCGMSVPALNAIGGVAAVKVAGSLCQAISAGDDASVRRTLPAAVQIAARATNVFAQDAFRFGMQQGSGIPAAGFGGASPGLEILGVNGTDFGTVAAFSGADPDDLAFGLAGVDAADLRAGMDAAKGSNLVLAPALIAVAAGLWIAFRG